MIISLKEPIEITESRQLIIYLNKNNNTLENCNIVSTIKDDIKEYKHIVFKHCNILGTFYDTCITDCTFEYCHINNCSILNSWIDNNHFDKCEFSYIDISNFSHLGNLCITHTKEAIYLNISNSSGNNIITDFPKDMAMLCPEGSIIGYKMVENCLITLKIPAVAERLSAFSTICRCNFAKVLSIYNINTNHYEKTINNNYYENSCIYQVGEIVKPDNFDTDRFNECSHGIHFFLNISECMSYNGYNIMNYINDKNIYPNE